MKYISYFEKKVIKDFLYIIILTLLIIKIFLAYIKSSSFFSTEFLSYLFSIKPDIVKFINRFSIHYLVKLSFLLIWIFCLHFIIFKIMLCLKIIKNMIIKIIEYESYNYSYTLF